MRVLADFKGHTTQQNLKVIVERGVDIPEQDDPLLVDKVQQVIKNSLSFKAQVIVVAANSFSKPGVAKVALTLREIPDFLNPSEKVR